MSPAISVITPSFNQGRFLERTIQSVLSQRIEGLEYHVVDGGSTDDTLAILARHGDRLQWRSEPDRGQAHAVNKGIRRARGEIIGWLNSDDIYYPGALAAVLQCFAAHPETEILYGDADHIDELDRVLEPYPTEDWDYDRLQEVCFLCQPAVFFRRRLVDRVGLLDERLHYCMDYEYWLRIGRTTSFRRVPQSLAGSRLYPGNKTLGCRLAVHKEINDMLRRRLGRIPAKWLLGYAHAEVNHRPVDRSRPGTNLIYLARLGAAGLRAFWDWRQVPRRGDGATIGKWGRGALRAIRKR
jgi:glycosyltransferase involved in cell wall biosynthesis